MTYLNQRAAALITALFLVGLAAVLATSLSLNARLFIHHTQLVINNDQAYLDLQGLKSWAVLQLSHAQKEIKAPGILFNQTMKAKFNQATISAKLVDQEGLFNINSLINPSNQGAFAHLLEIVDPTINDTLAKTLAHNISYWLLPTRGVEDRYYRHQKPPYRPFHGPMTDISELRSVKGVSGEIYTKLAPYISALPAKATDITSININNTPAEILQLMGKNIELADAKVIKDCIASQGPFKNIDDFKKECLSRQDENPLIHWKTSSQYFLIRGKATLAHQYLLSKTLLFVPNTIPLNKKGGVVVLWQQ